MEVPEVALIDLDLPPSGGVAAVVEVIERSAAAAIMCSFRPTKEAVVAAIREGASDYVEKEISPRALVRSVRGLLDGEAALSRSLVTLLVEAVRGLDARNEARQQLAVLSAREQEVLLFLAHGARNKQIAAALTISEFTVKRHVQNILRKLAVPSRRAAAVFYRTLANDGEQLVSADAPAGATLERRHPRFADVVPRSGKRPRAPRPNRRRGQRPPSGSEWAVVTATESALVSPEVKWYESSGGRAHPNRRCHGHLATFVLSSVREAVGDSGGSASFAARTTVPASSSLRAARRRGRRGGQSRTVRARGRRRRGRDRGGSLPPLEERERGDRAERRQDAAAGAEAKRPFDHGKEKQLPHRRPELERVEDDERGRDGEVEDERRHPKLAHPEADERARREDRRQRPGPTLVAGWVVAPLDRDLEKGEGNGRESHSRHPEGDLPLTHRRRR